MPQRASVGVVRWRRQGLLEEGCVDGVGVSRGFSLVVVVRGIVVITGIGTRVVVTVIVAAPAVGSRGFR